MRVMVFLEGLGGVDCTAGKSVLVARSSQYPSADGFNCCKTVNAMRRLGGVPKRTVPRRDWAAVDIDEIPVRRSENLLPRWETRDVVPHFGVLDQRRLRSS